MMDQEFRVGQVVHIATERVDDCWEWLPDMDRYFGAEARITYIDELEDLVKIDIDDGKFWWSYDMFQEYVGYILDDAFASALMDSLFDGLCAYYERRKNNEETKT